ncbi:MAG: enoyl-CoA hydratase-related protein [Pseudomonadota bacterium]
MSFETIKVTIDSGIGKILLNRPDKLNSLTQGMMREIHQAVDELENETEIRLLVFTGSGRAFCAGQDLDDPVMQMVDDTPPDIGALVESLYKPLVMKLQNLRMPTLAAVNGLAAGGGSALVLACDFVVASRSAFFLQAFSNIGLTPDTGTTWFLPHRLGMARAAGLTMLGDKLPAAKAAEWGLIWDVFDDDVFQTEIASLTHRLAKRPTTALVRTRQLLYAAHSHSLEQQLSMEATFIREMGWRKDYQEGVSAFTERRTPKFTGE